MFAYLVRKERADNTRGLGYEEELPTPLSKPATLRTQPRPAGGLPGREREPHVAAGHGGSQEIELDRVRDLDLAEDVGL